MIELKNIKKRYYEQEYILDDISIKIDKGEYVQIVGQSGSGKSTLLNLIGLLDDKYEGDLFIDNKNVSKLSDRRLSKLRSEYLGFVFQSYNLINHMTVLENIKLPLIYSDKNYDFIYSERINMLIKELQLEKLIYKEVQYLSGGEKQRVAIARALSLEPKIILADEPTGNLDKINSKIVFDTLKKQADNGKTVIIVTHNWHDDLGTNKILKLENGKLVCGCESFKEA